MATRVSPPGVEDVKVNLDRVLGLAGFSREQATQWVQGRGFDRWVRVYSWKRDVFEIDYPKRGPLGIGAKTLVKILVPDREVTADGASVAYLAGRHGDYLLDKTAGPDVFQRTIEEDARNAVRWFEQYRSPASALERMQTAIRNGCGKGTTPYEAAVAFLRSQTPD